MNIQTAVQRKCVCDDAMALQNSQEYIDAQNQAAVQAKTDACYKRIIDWCNTTDNTSQLAISNKIIIGIDGISQNTITAWEEELTAKGYVIVQNNGAMIISLD